MLNSPFVAVHTRYFAQRPAIGPVVAPGESEYAGSGSLFLYAFFVVVIVVGVDGGNGKDKREKQMGDDSGKRRNRQHEASG